ncbi:MAG TPA: ABC transporter ATP-binding protein [Candidatus Hydrogenedentes bacterium]|nr:ABC transporter ATP-binding protein [Candidatus Hydrogenedentota bacterium]
MSQPIIEIKDLSVTYKTDRREQIPAVTGLSLDVYEGEVVGFIGPNGAGKTTTIKALLGFRFPSAGSARVFGLPAGSVESRKRIGYLPEVAQYYPFLTARETLKLYAKLGDIPKENHESLIDELIAKVRLTGRDREPLRGYSKGMLQRVGIAQAIMGSPDLLILDEVTSGLDPVARLHVRNLLLEFKHKGKTVFFSSHELTEVTMLCDRVVIIDGGRVVEQKTMADLRHAMRTFTVVAAGPSLPDPLPEGTQILNGENGRVHYTTPSKASCERIVQLLKDNGGEDLRIEVEAGSLEDYFVTTIGHKVS